MCLLYSKVRPYLGTFRYMKQDFSLATLIILWLYLHIFNEQTFKNLSEFSVKVLLLILWVCFLIRNFVFFFLLEFHERGEREREKDQFVLIIW